jgi:hypothetical protein
MASNARGLPVANFTNHRRKAWQTSVSRRVGPSGTEPNDLTDAGHRFAALGYEPGVRGNHWCVRLKSFFIRHNVDSGVVTSTNLDYYRDDGVKCPRPEAVRAPPLAPVAAQCD